MSAGMQIFSATVSESGFIAPDDHTCSLYHVLYLLFLLRGFSLQPELDLSICEAEIPQTHELLLPLLQGLKLGQASHASRLLPKRTIERRRGEALPLGYTSATQKRQVLFKIFVCRVYKSPQPVQPWLEICRKNLNRFLTAPRQRECGAAAAGGCGAAAGLRSPDRPAADPPHRVADSPWTRRHIRRRHVIEGFLSAESGCYSGIIS